MSHIPAVEVDLEQARSTLEMVYARILETGEADSAKRIWEACEFLAKNKAKKITASAVGDYCSQKFGGPKAQSISNKQETLAQLVRWWQTVYALENGRVAKSAVAGQSNTFIDDPTVAAYVRVLEAKMKELQAENQRINKAFRELKPLQIGFLPASSDGNALLPPNMPAVTDVERDSIRTFLSKSHLDKFDLHIDEKKRVKDSLRVLMERPVVELLLRLAGQS